jgi:hypothetical protein
MHERRTAGHTDGMVSDADGRAEHGTAPGSHLPGERPIGGHEHLHGRPVSWVLVGVLIVAFIAGGLAIVNQLWWLFWICLGVTVLSVPSGKIIGIMNDTVLNGDPAQQVGQGGTVAEDTGSAADPGVYVGSRAAARLAERQPAVGR